jgi:hypothetical protein
MGQPIMIGHHSEKRHRRDLARIDRAERTAFAELGESERLQEQAESSARHQAYKATAPAMAKRLDRLQTEERQLATLVLPSGETIAAAVKTRTSYAAEHVRHTYAALIRYTLQRLTNKHVVLFVRGPNDSPWIGPPDGYPFEAA